MAVRQYIGARYVPLFFENELGGNDWRANTQYEPLTIVTYNSNSYTSKKQVPASVGDPANNADYWASTGIYNAQVEEYRQEVQQVQEDIEAANREIQNTNKQIGSYSFKGLKIIGHAGASGLAPENTIASFNMAAMLKADAIECDLQITSDNVLVCCHNDTVNSYVIKQTSSDTILQQTVTGTYASKFAEQKVPKFEDFVKICKNAGCECVVEFKWEGTHIGVDQLHLVKEMLDLYDMFERSVFISWYSEPLDAFLALYPNAKVMLLLGDPTPLTDANIVTCANKGYYGVGIVRGSSTNYIGVAHYNGLVVNIFTLANNDTTTEAVLSAGADYVTTTTIIDVGPRQNPYTSTAAGRVAAIYGRNGQAVMHKFFQTCPDEFPTLNSTTSRFATNAYEKSFPARYSVLSNVYCETVRNVASGDVISVKVPDGYRFGVTCFGVDGSFVNDSGWITTTGTYTVPANSAVAICYAQKGTTGSEALDYWDLQTVCHAFSIS